MRIQHNIMAMSAYRNYTNNVSAMKKNLEKLSSGYKINRAGDDAAGLAISEKMRAQITGLETAQKNAKDGISLVQTAEGALTEVHDMLNRMVELASQSANGTYSDEVDREQLQKELEQLTTEIDRISKASNFNGIALLDGSMSAGGGGTSVEGIDRIISAVLGAGEDPVKNTGVKTILDGGGNSTQPTKFDVDFNGLKATAADGAGGGNGGGTPAVKAKYSFDLSGVTADAANMSTKVIDGQALTFNADLDTTMGDFVTAYNGDNTKTYTANWDAATKKLTLEAKVGGAVAAGPTTDLQGTTNTAATNDTWKATLTLGGAFADGDTLTKADGTTLTVVDDATGTGGDATKITETDANALGIDDLQVTIGNATAVTGYTITGDATKEITFTADNAGAVGNSGPGAAPTNGDLPAVTAMGGRTFSWTLTNTTAGAEAGTTTATLTATEDVPGADEVPGGGGGGGAAGDIEVSFKLGGTDIVLLDEDGNDATSVKVNANDTATAIATAIFGALKDGDAAADGTQVTINGAKWNVTDGGDGKLTFELADDPNAKNIQGNFDWDVSITGGKFEGNHTAGTVVTQQGQVGAANATANTVFKMEAGDIVDGTKITIDGTTVTLAVGAKSTQDTTKTGVIDLTDMEAGSVDLNKALGKISEGFKDGTTNFIVGVNDTSNSDAQKGLTVHKKDGSNETYDTKEKLAAVFSMTTPGTGKALTLQIGDTADGYNQLKVDIKACDSKSIGLDGIDISTQDGATDAITKIKDAINYVSDVRGGLGATQNRLDHTINNLSVMTENIQDAESTIRDVDVAEEMMAYTKNNILIQSAQAMLAQANQVPQGVLQLLQ